MEADKDTPMSIATLELRKQRAQVLLQSLGIHEDQGHDDGWLSNHTDVFDPLVSQRSQHQDASSQSLLSSILFA